MSAFTTSKTKPALPDQAAIERWIAEHGVTQLPVAVANGISMPYVSVPPDMRGDDALGDAYRARDNQRGWSKYWQNKRGNRLTGEQKAKAARARSQQIHDRKGHTCEPSGV
jgi:hypothetical protein